MEQEREREEIQEVYTNTYIEKIQDVYTNAYRLTAKFGNVNALFFIRQDRCCIIPPDLYILHRLKILLNEKVIIAYIVHYWNHYFSPSNLESKEQGYD